MAVMPSLGMCGMGKRHEEKDKAVYKNMRKATPIAYACMVS